MLRTKPRALGIAVGISISIASMDAFAQEGPAEPPSTPDAPPTDPAPVPEEPAAEPAATPAAPKQSHRARQEAWDREHPPQKFLQGAFYPGVKQGYVSADATFETAGGSVKTDASTVVWEPHVDGLLIFEGVIGVGASGGYLVPFANGLGGWTFTPFLMLAITPRLSVKANIGVVEGSVNYNTSAVSPTDTSIDTSALRYGGGIFYALTQGRGMLCVGLEVLHMESATKDNAAYSGTGGILDLAISFGGVDE